MTSNSPLSLLLSLILLSGYAMATCPMASKILAARNNHNFSFTDAHANAHPPVKKHPVGFNPLSQLVSTTGKHAFVPPGPGDFRGPCPGLNAMANHRYIPHNGIATIDEIVTGGYEAFGMGSDLALLLATYGTVLDGEILSLSFSIGKGPNSLLGSLLRENGLTGSHNNYEADVSPTRGDLFQYGNNHDVQMSQFLQLYNLQANIPDSQVNYDIDVLTAFRVSRFQQSIENNPYFFNGVVTGISVQPAAYQFIFRFMANKSAEYPEGRLDREVLKSFYAITGSEDNLVYTPGYERIPDNWYKRAIGDEYGLVSLLLELVEIALQHPQFLSIGGNTDGVNTFTGIDLEDLTGGVYHTSTLLEKNNLGCLILQAGMIAISAAGVGGLLEGVFEELNGVVDPLLGMWDCPELAAIDETLLERFPGYNRRSGNQH